jgi:CheY-like chemotaxis protein
VVDDNHDVAKSLAMMLRLHGHEVRVAHDGFAALEIARTDRPDVVLLDLGMPGMDGYEVARRLRREPGLENALLAAVSGYGQEEDLRRTREAGFDDHLTKPVDMAQLQGLLGQLQRATPVPAPGS